MVCGSGIYYFKINVMHREAGKKYGENWEIRESWMIEKWILDLVYRWKPILVRLVPISCLKKVKNGLIKSSYKKQHSLQRQLYQKGNYPDGINLIGSIRAETGLGQSCRLVANAIFHSSYPITIYPYRQVGNLRQTDTSWDAFLSEECRYSINLIHINPHEFGIAWLQMDRSIWDGRYNIGFWLWELEEFPEEWLPCFQAMDEIWTPSEFTSNSIRKKTDLPVYTMPYGIEAETEQGWSRADFGLPEEKFLFLMMYDPNSITERKNPIGVIRAFQKAFSKERSDVGLVIKVNLPDKQEFERLNHVLDGYQNVYWITKSFEKKQVNSLIASVDAVVSLHRAEGFGLVLAEAMLLGTPTIATNWSSNTEFMNETIACMVDYSLVELKEAIGPFQKGQHWADADLEQAAGYMQKLVEDRAFGRQMAERAKESITNQLSVEQAAKRVDLRIKEIIEKDGI